MTNKVKEEVNRIQNIENFMRNKSSQQKKCNQDSKPGTKKPQILMNKRKLNHEKQPNSTTNRN